jgi:hypothetical protein
MEVAMLRSLRGLYPTERAPSGLDSQLEKATPHFNNLLSMLGCFGRCE